MPIATPSITTALENSLDMCFSALYMHELHRKYHHGDYIDLDNVKEESDDNVNEEQMYQRQPLLLKNKKSNKNRDDESENSHDESDHLNNQNSTLINHV